MIQVTFVKDMPGFARKCYKSDKNYYCLQEGKWYVCSKDFEPAYETTRKVVIV